MAANVETMFYVRQVPWHGLGTCVQKAPSSEDALILSGLDWEVERQVLKTKDGIPVPGYYANVRTSDNKVLGVVSDKYAVVQNREAFAFTDELLGAGVRYETAGSLMGGRRVWMLAKLPNEYIIKGDRISPYMVFSNNHDGSGSIKVALTPIRVVCNNTLCMALQTAQRSWSTRHTGDIRNRMEEAKETLFRAAEYMDNLGKAIEGLHEIRISRKQVEEEIRKLLPVPDNATALQEKNVETQRKDIMQRYLYAPDLKNLPENGYRFYNAVSDYANHAKPLRETNSYQENIFAKAIDGNPFLDKAYKQILQAA